MKPWTKDLRVWLALSLSASVAAETLWLRRESRRADALAARWRKACSQEEQLAALAPTPANEQAMAADAERLRHELARRRAELWPATDAPAAEGDMTTAVDAYFDVAAMTSRLRAKAAAAGIAVKSDERFGFDAYSHEGPPAAGMTAVRRQCAASEAVLACLFAAQPQALVSVKRERVEPPGATADGQARDYFVLAPSLSSRVPGEIETVAIRVEFRGGTPVLRRFLDGLARAPAVLTVRSIGVAPAEGPKGGGAGKPSDEEAPVVRSAPSQFIVIVEAVLPPRVAPTVRS